MLILKAAVDQLELVTGSSADIEVHVSAMKADASTPPGVQPVPDLGPAASILLAQTSRILDTSGMTSGHVVNVKHLNIRNNHASQSCVCTVQVTDTSVSPTDSVSLMSVTLLAGESLVFTQGGIWIHYDSNGGVYPSIGNAAAQSDMEAGTSNSLFVTPLGFNWHPGACKFWAKATPGGTLNGSWNVTSEADATAGVCDITIATDFSSTNYAAWAMSLRANTNTTVTDAKNTAFRSGTYAAGSISVETYDQTAINVAIEDPTSWSVGAFGDQ